MYPDAGINLSLVAYRDTRGKVVDQFPRVYPILSPERRYKPSSALHATQSTTSKGVK